MCSAETPGARISVGGWTKAGKYITHIDGVDVELTHTSWNALLLLLRARLMTDTGVTSLLRLAPRRNTQYQIIYRLRRTLDTFLGDGSGKRLIVYAARAWYSVAVRPEEISVHQSLRELVPAHVEKALVDDLLAHARIPGQEALKAGVHVVRGSDRADPPSLSICSHSGPGL